MSQIPTENDDNNRTIAASDFVQFDQQEDLADQEEYLEKTAEVHAMKEKAEQKALKAETMNELKDEFEKILSTQNEVHQKEMVQLKDKFAKMLAEQQTQMMTQFNSLEQKLKDAEQRAQMGKNELEEIIHANQQKMEKFPEEMNEKIKQAISSNRMGSDNMSSSQMLTKSKKLLANPKGNVWNGLNTNATITKCGLKANNNTACRQWVFATEGYAISGKKCRKQNIPIPGTFYFEVTITTSARLALFSVGFTDGTIPAAGGPVGAFANSYGVAADCFESYGCWVSGNLHQLESPIGTGATGSADLIGCGLLLNSTKELAVFFTLNGILLGKQTPINPKVNRLYPTVTIYFPTTSVEANFGDNLDVNPFKFDIEKCPGLAFE